jgi:hypothetical protein
MAGGARRSGAARKASLAALAELQKLLPCLFFYRLPLDELEGLTLCGQPGVLGCT